jgi:O-antigen ligase
MIRNRFAAPRLPTRIPVGLASILLVIYGVGVVTLFTSGRLLLPQAGLLLALPVVLVLTILRPEWAIIPIVLIPPAVAVPVGAMTLILVAALFGFLLQGGVRLGPSTGTYALVAIVLLALVLKADTAADAAIAASSMLDLMVYYTLLVLVAFHAIADGRLHIDTFISALLVGLIAAALLQPFLGVGPEASGANPFRGQFAYLSVIGFGVSFTRMSLVSSPGRVNAFDAFLVLAFLALAVVGFGRAEWISGLLVVGLVSRWTGRKTIWIVVALVAVVALMVPVVGERVLPGGTADLTNPETLARVTTGRSLLWGELWRRGVEALPEGQGWGYVWSLTPNDIFGVEEVFQAGGNPFVFPHNDFLYLFVELGIFGSGLLIAFWFQLLRKIRLLSRSGAEARYGYRVLIPVFIVMLLVQMFDNGFAIRFVAEKFFIAAGLVFGMFYLVHHSHPSHVGSESLDTSRGISALDG